MDGTPVWLCSLSRRTVLTNKIVPTTRWSHAMMTEADALIDAVLGELGDKARQRSFRMQVTLCGHRACSPGEVRHLPPDFWHGPATGLAGGPVDILWETVPGSLSTKPCEHPRRQRIDASSADPDLWIPIECGVCPSCLARARIDAAA